MPQKMNFLFQKQVIYYVAKPEFYQNYQIYFIQ